MSTSSDKSRAGPRCWFNAVLHPHRSLSERGFFLLMTVFCAVAFCLGTGFYVIGAWPVFGFLGLDILGVYIAFRVNYRRGRLFETVQLTDDALTVRRVQPSGQAREWRFPPAGLQVRLMDTRAGANIITLAAHERRIEIGNFLSPDERGDFAAALRMALAERQASFSRL